MYLHEKTGATAQSCRTRLQRIKFCLGTGVNRWDIGGEIAMIFFRVPRFVMGEGREAEIMMRVHFSEREGDHG